MTSNDVDAVQQAKAVELVADYWPGVSESKDQRADILVDATPNGKSTNATPLFSATPLKDVSLPATSPVTCGRDAI